MLLYKPSMTSAAPREGPLLASRTQGGAAADATD